MNSNNKYARFPDLQIQRTKELLYEGLTKTRTWDKNNCLPFSVSLAWE